MKRKDRVVTYLESYPDANYDSLYRYMNKGELATRATELKKIIAELNEEGRTNYRKAPRLVLRDKNKEVPISEHKDILIAFLKNNPNATMYEMQSHLPRIYLAQKGHYDRLPASQVYNLLEEIKREQPDMIIPDVKNPTKKQGVEKITDLLNKDPSLTLGRLAARLNLDKTGLTEMLRSLRDFGKIPEGHKILQGVN